MEYLDFDVHIAPGTGRDYPVSVVKSPVGEATATLHFPFDAFALESQLKGLELAVLKSGSLRRDIVLDAPEKKPAVDFGTQMFEALFTDAVQMAFRRSQDRARTEKKGLRVRLRIDAPDLSALPWEFLYDPSTGDYVCLSSDTPVVRYLEFSRPPEALTVQAPIVILAMIASPNDRPKLDVQHEIERMTQATATLQEAGLLRLEWMEGSTWRDLQRTLRRGDYHIFHFVGHGGFDAIAGEGVLAFTNDTGGSQLLGATEVGSLLADERSLRLVVLNACLGARGNTTDVFSSTSATLVRRGVPAVVAMQYEISDLAAIEFSRSLYEAIADGMPIDAAVGEARKAVRLSARNSVEWGTPVLHMRSPDGVLFKVDSSNAAPRPKAQAAPSPAPVAAAQTPLAPAVTPAAPVAAPAPAMAQAPAAPAVQPAPGAALPGATVPLMKRPLVLAGIAFVMMLAFVVWLGGGRDDLPPEGQADEPTTAAGLAPAGSPAGAAPDTAPTPEATHTAVARAYLQAISGGAGPTNVPGAVDFAEIGCTYRTVWDEDKCQAIVFDGRDGKTLFMEAITEVAPGEDWEDSNIENLLPAEDMHRIMTDTRYARTKELFQNMSGPKNGWYTWAEGPGMPKDILRQYMNAVP